MTIRICLAGATGWAGSAPALAIAKSLPTYSGGIPKSTGAGAGRRAERAHSQGARYMQLHRKRSRAPL